MPGRLVERTSPALQAVNNVLSRNAPTPPPPVINRNTNINRLPEQTGGSIAKRPATSGRILARNNPPAGPIPEQNISQPPGLAPGGGAVAPAGGVYNSAVSGYNSPLSFADPNAGLAGVGGSAAVIPDVGSDPTYQSGVSDLAKQLADYKNQQGLMTGQYDTNFNTGLRQLGWNGTGFDRGNMQGLYGQALNDNQNDFAARGILHSGLFGNADSQLNNQFADRKTQLDTARQQFLDTQNLAGQQYDTQNTFARNQLMQDAISRIAAKYGVGLDAVPLGTAGNK